MIFEQFSTIGEDVVVRFLLPVYKVVMGQDYRYFVGYLAAAITFGLLVLLARGYEPNLGLSANLRRAFGGLFRRDVLLHKSAKLDYRFAIINHLVTSAVLIYLLIAINASSTVFYALFASLPLLADLNITVGILGSVLIVALYALAYDTANFFQHYVQHKIPILWEFHKVHHSAEVLTPVTAVRLHPVAQLISATTSAIVYGSLNGLTFNIFAGETAQYSLFGANMFALLFYTLGLYHLKHSHIWFTYPRWIKEIFASPSLHLIHHSNNSKHYDKNFGFVFTFWDRVFGTYYDPKEEEQHGLALGISKSEGRDEYCTVKQLYLTPFKRAWKYHLKPLLGKGKNQTESEQRAGS